MECKVKKHQKLISDRENWNITRMECKDVTEVTDATELPHWNITRMECKVEKGKL